MRIVHVTCLYPPEHRGGAPQVCRNLAIEQHRRGEEVAVFSGVLAPGMKPYTIVDRKQDGLPVRRLITNPGFPDGSELNYHHPAVEPAFEEFLQQRRPEVVHFHAIQSLGGSLLPLAKRAGARVVVTMHDLWWVCPRLFCVDKAWKPCIPAVAPGSCACEIGVEALATRRQFLTEMLGHCDAILTPSDAIRERLVMSGIEPPIAVNANGVTRPAASPADRATNRERPLRVLYVGGQYRQKGIHVLAAAFRTLEAEGAAVSLDVYGVDDLGFDTARLFAGTGAKPHKPFEPEEREAVFTAHDVLVLPSVMYESSSLAVREALVYRLGVVATEAGGPEEIIEDGVNGLLVPRDDPDALAAAIRRLAGDRDLLDRIRRAGSSTPVPTVAEQVDALAGVYAKPPPRSLRTNTRGRRVLFVAGIDGSPLHYRVHQKIEQLALYGVDSVLRRYSDPRLATDLDGADVVVVYRSPATVELIRFIQAAHRRGIPVFFDVDDLIFDPELAARLPTLQRLPADERELWVEGVRRYRATLLECGAGIASTPEIARQMEQIGVPARVHRNGVDTPLAVVSERARRARGSRLAGGDGSFVLGYSSGTRTHDVDLSYVTEALAGFLGAHPEARLVLGGLLIPDSALTRLGDRVRRLSFVGWPNHPDRLTTFDLNLAPLIDSVFNEAKSSIKWSEAALVDVPTLAMATEPFRDSVVDGETGLLAKDAREWRERLEEAIGDRDRLARIGRRARTAAYAQGSPWVLGADLVEILFDERPQAPEAGRPESWPSEVAVANLEPAGLLPGLYAPPEGTTSVAGESLGERTVAFPLPAEAGPLRRVDVLVATYLQAVKGPMTVTVRSGAGRPLASRSVPPEEIADNGWAAFEFEAPVDAERGAIAELTAETGERLAPYVTAEGTRFVDGRRREGAVVARTFHEPPVPPDFGSEWATVAAPAVPRAGARAVARYASLAARRATYILRTEGPVQGGRRIFHGVLRRVRR